MDKTLIIHIGTHKTGTTSIQDSLLNNVNHLLNQNILFLPLNRYRFILQALNHNDANLNVFEEFKNSRFSTLLISAERLSGPIAKYTGEFTELINLKKIARQLGFKIKVICYIRRQDTFLESTYMQKVKWGNQAKFSQFLQNHQHYQNLYDFVSRLYAVFAEHELYIVPFESSNLKNADVVDDFWEKIGLNFCAEKHLYKPQIRNVSYGFTAMEITRKLNKFTNANQKNKYRQILENIDHQDKLSTLFTQSEHKEFCQMYQESNKKLCKRMGWPTITLAFCEKDVYFHYKQFSSVEGTELFYQLIATLTLESRTKNGIKVRLNKFFKRWRFYLNPIILKLEIMNLKHKYTSE